MPKTSKNPVAVGDVFGDLTVISIRHRQAAGQRRLEARCRCSCQTELVVLVQGLRQGKKDCGHVRSDASIKPGDVLGDLSVLTVQHGPKKNGQRPLQATCLCACGIEKTMLVSTLRAGTTNCGHARAEQSRRQANEILKRVRDARLARMQEYQNRKRPAPSGAKPKGAGQV